MRKVLNIIISMLFGCVLSALLLFLFDILYWNLWQINILSHDVVNNILLIANKILHANIMLGIAFTSLSFGLIFVFLSVTFLSVIYFYKFLHSFCCSKSVKQKQFYQLDTLKKRTGKGNNVQIKKQDIDVIVKSEPANLANADKKHNLQQNAEKNNPEIPLPKSITNSDAYSVVQRMQNNNQDPLNMGSMDNVKVIEKQEVKSENMDTKNDELRRRILKKFNTSLGEVAQKKN